ncbi:MAG: nicotinate (nicotinamide) nucleotide adenylyltransferase [Deltaproteobacteria bacterium]|nr:nicotinate (nicotinamide) nucleotide adenylyltransferase [Deltaproteobacteria bacterium]
MLKRAGLFGGTFNPVHLGHLRVAQEIKDGFSLDRMFFVLSAIPPHKPSSIIAGTIDRLEMLNRAVSTNPDFIASDMEANRPGPSYTIDTVNQFQKLHPSFSKVFLIVGIDAFLEIDTWKDYRDLFDRISVIVMSRPPMHENEAIHPAGHTGHQIDSVGEVLKQHIDPAYRYIKGKNRFEARLRMPVRFKAVTPIGITSTMVRKLTGKSASIRYLVPEGVAEYIEEKRLYL